MIHGRTLEEVDFAVKLRTEYQHVALAFAFYDLPLKSHYLGTKAGPIRERRSCKTSAVRIPLFAYLPSVVAL